MEGVGLERVTWPGKGKCDLWDGGVAVMKEGGCHALGWVPWSGVRAMQQGWCHAAGRCCGQH